MNMKTLIHGGLNIIRYNFHFSCPISIGVFVYMTLIFTCDYCYRDTTQTPFQPLQWAQTPTLYQIFMAHQRLRIRLME